MGRRGWRGEGGEVGVAADGLRLERYRCAALSVSRLRWMPLFATLLVRLEAKGRRQIGQRCQPDWKRRGDDS